MAMLSKECKPNNFESHNSLKLSFTIFPWIKLSNDDTNLDDSIDSGNLCVTVIFI